jgi:hypothetical protein
MLELPLELMRQPIPALKAGPNPGPTALSNLSGRLVRWITTNRVGIRMGIAMAMGMGMGRARALVIR